MTSSVNRVSYQFHWFPDGGAVLHKLDAYTTDKWSTSVWFNAEGQVIDIDIHLRFGDRSKNIKKNGPTWRAVVDRATPIFNREKAFRDRPTQSDS